MADAFDNIAAAQPTTCDPPFWVRFIPLLEEQTFCQIVNVVKGSFAFAHAISSDERFEFATNETFSLFGFGIPLPDDPLLNYAVTCSIGPLRNVLSFLWAD